MAETHVESCPKVLDEKTGEVCGRPGTWDHRRAGRGQKHLYWYVVHSEPDSKQTLKPTTNAVTSHYIGAIRDDYIAKHKKHYNF